MTDMRFDFGLRFLIALLPRLVREEMFFIFIFCQRNLGVELFLRLNFYALEQIWLIRFQQSLLVA